MPFSAPLAAEIQIRLFSAPVLLLLLGSAGLYVASRAAVDALARGKGATAAGTSSLASPAFIALGHWMPIVVVTLWAVWRGLPNVALGVAFGSSVAALSMAMGLITYLAPPGPLPASRRAWPFVLAGAMVPLIAGISSQLTGAHAIVMLLLGSTVWSLWSALASEKSVADVLTAATPGQSPQQVLAYDPGQLSRASAIRMALRVAQFVLAIGLAIVAARMVLLGTVRADMESRTLRAALNAAAVLSPVLILPVLASGTDMAHRGRSADAAAALVALSMLNLFALLPAIILFWYVRSAAPTAGLLAGILGAWSRGQPIPMPLGVWQIDVVVLTILGFALVPVAMGRWAIGRLESAGLIVAYAAYIGATVWLTQS